MSAEGRLRRVPWTDLGIAIAAVAAVVGIAGVFTTAVDFSGLVGSQLRVGLAGVGIVWGAAVVRGWVNAESGGYEPPERERAVPAAVPGDDLDDLLALGRSAGTPEATRYYRSQSRDRLQAIAIDVLCTHRGIDAETAREQLRDGTWTDDETAASYFQLRVNREASDEVVNVFRRPVGGEHPQVGRVRRALRELDRVTEVNG